MSIGMAVNCGQHDTKLNLARQLEEARINAIDLGLYVNGAPFEILLAQVAQALRRQAAKELQP